VNPAVIFADGGGGGGSEVVTEGEGVTVAVEVVVEVVLGVLDQGHEQEAVSAQAANTATAENRRTAAT
jgi:hypothetical protein